MSNSNRLQYSFTTYGHENILAKNFKTLEFNKDDFLTERGDCIIGIKSTFELNELKRFSKKAKIVCKITDPKTNIEYLSEFKFKVNESFNSNSELVLRKSGFDSERTYGFGLNRGANHLDKNIVEILKNNPEIPMSVTVIEGWYDDND